VAFLLLPGSGRDSGNRARVAAAGFGANDVTTMVTFANYQLMAIAAAAHAFLSGTSPSICPMGRKAKVVFAIALGLLTAAFSLYLSCSFGPYVALLLAGLLSPWLDEIFRKRPLIVRIGGDALAMLVN